MAIARSFNVLDLQFDVLGGELQHYDRRRKHDCLVPSEHLRYNETVPPAPVWEGVFIDDRVTEGEYEESKGIIIMWNQPSDIIAYYLEGETVADIAIAQTALFRDAVIRIGILVFSTRICH